MSTTLFEDTCRLVIPKLMEEFGWENFQAAGCMGNLGHESGGLEELREVAFLHTPARGGYGWAQWTGPRARRFLRYCEVNKLDWHSEQANYGYLVNELHEDYSHTVGAVAKTKTLIAATVAFERGYEAAGILSMNSRIHWAEIALASVRGVGAPPETIET
jgi:Phage tail lysozyme